MSDNQNEQESQNQSTNVAGELANGIAAHPVVAAAVVVGSATVAQVVTGVLGQVL